MHSQLLRRALPLLALALAVAPALPAAARPDTAPPPTGSFARAASGLFVPATVKAAIATDGEVELLIGLVDGMTDDAPVALLKAASARVQDAVTADYRPEELRVVSRYAGFPILHAWANAEGLRRLAADPRVASVEQVIKVYPLGPALRPALMPEGRVTVGADKVFERWGLDGTGVGVAVLDTGIDNDHPDFEGAIVAQQCYSEGSRSCAPRGLPKSDNAEDEYGHGTAVSSMILGRGVTKGLNEANKQVTALGIAPRASLLAVRVFRDNGGAYDPDIVAGLDWVLTKQKEHNVKAVNMSLGGGAEIGTNCDNNHATVKAAFARLVSKGVTVVVATGNGGNADRVAFPACISNAMSVGATYDKSYDGPARLANGGMWCPQQTKPDIFTIACFTDRGRSLDVLAPGLIITHAAMGGGLGSGAGTSYATPIVAGIVALLSQAKDDLRASDIQRLLQDTGRDVTHPESGDTLKLVDAFAALSKVMPAVPTTAATATATTRPADTATATRPPTTTPTVAPSAAPSDTPETAASATATSRPADTATPSQPAPSATPGLVRVFLPYLKRLD
jgi:subtilisin family serine protease